MRPFRARRSSGLMIARRFAAATGDIIFVQDADLEYNPGGARLSGVLGEGRFGVT